MKCPFCSAEDTQVIDSRVSEEGAHFKSYRDGSPLLLTPESSVRAQKAFGADIIIPLDELPANDVSASKLRESFGRSHRWMARSLVEHERGQDGRHKNGAG